MKYGFTVLLGASLYLAGGMPAQVRAEDGYDLWLRYVPLDAAARDYVAGFATTIVGQPRSATASPQLEAAATELQTGLSGMLATPVPISATITDGSIVLGTPESLPAIRNLGLPLAGLGPDGYVIRSSVLDGYSVTLIVANEDPGVLYGAFAFLRLVQTGEGLAALDIVSAPKIRLRLLNHWDNLDGSVERGYAGRSLWDWWRLPDFVDQRYTDYARASASIGINGTVLNNVNAQAEILSTRYLDKAAAIADALRPWGIRVYLSARFSAPIDLGGLDTADPLDPGVAAWWRMKAAEIYTRIPDFGGFLVKADSEGQPGPQGYGRTHADGANMLAAAVRPHGGIVLWRAFVYSQDDPEDRVKQAYREFVPLDGQFAANVIVQVKNGPLDFQPREPFHPLFGAMPRTPLALELQITQEYLGFSTHLAYLGSLYEEVLDADTHVAGSGSTVARIIDGSVHDHELTAISGVANVGADRDWTGSPFAQANWYAFGRLAWDPDLSAAVIADEWLRQTFTNDPAFVEPVLAIMLRSREAVVDYMTPLGLAHLMGTGHHYGPAPWVNDLARAEWNPFYYHRADRNGIGLDRTSAGTDAVSQYMPTVAQIFDDIESTPEEYLLWFHRLPWNHRMRSGRTLWEELVARYDHGVAEVESMQTDWAQLERFIDPERFAKAAIFLGIQAREARWWRDACIAYFSARSGRSLPAGAEPPQQSLDYYMSLEFPYAPGR